MASPLTGALAAPFNLYEFAKISHSLAAVITFEPNFPSMKIQPSLHV